MEERRLEGRFLCADLVRLTVLDLGCRELEAVLEDISPAGGCVQVEEEVPLGAAVRLTIGDSHVFTGKICYCSYRDCGYYVGVTFDQDSAWSEEEVTPQHLTNLEVLVRKAGSGAATRLYHWVSFHRHQRIGNGTAFPVRTDSLAASMISTTSTLIPSAVIPSIGLFWRIRLTI